MRPAQVQRNRDGRPDFMVTLGLAPPYAPDDVKQAYLAKARELHPDHGGNAQDFKALHEAYMQAREFLNIKGDSLRWISNQMQGYLESRELVEQLRQLGAMVETDSITWLKRSFGDFAELTESVLSVRLQNATHGQADILLNAMTANPNGLRRLTTLELSRCELPNSAIDKITVFKGLEQVNVSGNPLTKHAAYSLLNRLPSLRSLELNGSKVGWWAQRRIASELKKRSEALSAVPR